MAVKIRLKRLGKIRAPYYRVVVADSRTKRDGRVIEEIGKYHPTEEPSFIEINSERALYWLGVGAQPSPQVEALLKLTGDWGTFKGEKNPKNTVKLKEAKVAFVADEKKKAVLKPKASKDEEPATPAEVRTQAEPSADAVRDTAAATVETRPPPERRQGVSSMLSAALEHLVKGIVDNPDDVHVVAEELTARRGPRGARAPRGPRPRDRPRRSHGQGAPQSDHGVRRRPQGSRRRGGHRFLRQQSPQDPTAGGAPHQGARPEGCHQARAVHRRARAAFRAGRGVHPAGAHRLALARQDASSSTNSSGTTGIPSRSSRTSLTAPSPRAWSRRSSGSTTTPRNRPPTRTPGTTTSWSACRCCATAWRSARVTRVDHFPAQDLLTVTHRRRPRGAGAVRHRDRPRGGHRGGNRSPSPRRPGSSRSSPPTTPTTQTPSRGIRRPSRSRGLPCASTSSRSSRSSSRCSTSRCSARPARAGSSTSRVHDLRDYTHDRHRTVDDTPYGGGAGMVMKPEPWGEALDSDPRRRRGAADAP